VLQSRQVARVGGTAAIPIDVRVVASSNEDLRAKVERGEFREDLFYRLNVIPVFVPPLRERRSDIPLLAAHFLDLGRQRLGLGPVRLSDEARERLVGADWPGNVRELENVISRGVLRAARQKPERAGPLLIGVESLDLEPVEPSGSAPAPADAPVPGGRIAPPPSLAERTEAFRRREILAAVARHRGNWAAAARDLGLHRSNFHHLAKRMGIRKEH